MTAQTPPGPAVDALALVRARSAGMGLPAWLVGGAVRDRLLGRPTLDTDVVVPTQAVALARDIARVGGGSLVVLDAGRDMARVVWPGPPRVILDVTGFAGPDLQADLRARDFTVNALALPLEESATGDPVMVLDPTGGLADLDGGILRMTSPAALVADPLRMLRGVRIAQELGFAIEPVTTDAIRSHASLASQSAGERVRDELLRLLAGQQPAQAVRLLDHLGLLSVLLPEVSAGQGVTQSPPHDRDVFEHGLAVLAAVAELSDPQAQPRAAAVLPAPWPQLLETYGPRLLAGLVLPRAERPRTVFLRLAGLLHDIGKPGTRSVAEPGGRVRFLRHEVLGAELARGIAGRLRIGGREESYLVGLIRHHLRPLHLADGIVPSRRAVYRYFRATGALGVDLPLLALADGLGKGALPTTALSDLGLVAASLWRAWFDEPEAVIRPVPLLRGDELMAELGLRPGPLVGELVEAIRAAQAAGTVTNRDQALVLARRHVARAGPASS